MVLSQETEWFSLVYTESIILVHVVSFASIIRVVTQKRAPRDDPQETRIQAVWTVCAAGYPPPPNGEVQDPHLTLPCMVNVPL